LYKVIIKKEAQRGIRKLPPDEIPGIIKKAYTLENNPRPFGCEKLKGSTDGYRVPKGDYRILYTIDDGTKKVRIYRVGHRREVYRGL
jgi:mRNA interferase RelE/StbE